MERDIWSVLVGDEYGPGLKVALSFINQIPPELIVKAIQDIRRATSIGPMLYPSEYTSGRKFRNADDYEKVLTALLNLRHRLPGE